MRIVVVGTLAMLAVATPALAMNLGNLGGLAKTVLGGSSVLKTGQAKCGSQLQLADDESLALTVARAAAQRALPVSQFTILDRQANASATKQAQQPGFCAQTAKKKSPLLDAIKKAGQKLITARVLGI